MPLTTPTAREIDELLAGLALPSAALWGAASSGFQVEGGYNSPGRPYNNWHEWEHLTGNEPCGAAARFWESPWRDLDLAQSLGLGAHRLSVEWARVQPAESTVELENEPAWDASAVARYVEILAGCRERGLEPVVTLHHFAHPAWVGADLWLSDERVGRWLVFVARIVPELNAGLIARGQPPIRWWVTLNEPNSFAPATYLSQWMPPQTPLGLAAAGRTARALDALYAAHVQAYNVIHAWYEDQSLPSPMVGFNNFALDHYAADRLFVDLMLARSRGASLDADLPAYIADRSRAWTEAVAPLSSLVRPQQVSRWLMLEAARRLADRVFTPTRLPRLLAALQASHRPRPIDYVAFDYYDATLANQLKLASGAYDPWDWAAIPSGLHTLLRANASDGLPLLIAENGMATRHHAPRPDGVTREAFLRAHLFHVLRAVKDGVPLAGYLHWSLTDNYEWGKYAPRFGLYAVDYDDPQRQRRDDAGGAVFGALVRAVRAGDAGALAAALRGGPA